VIKILWAGLAAVAVLWPARLAGPLDGAPLDQLSEAIVIGLVCVWLVASSSDLLMRTSFRALVVTLLVWKAVTGAVLAQDGWCLRFTSPQPLYLDNVLVPHSWDIRADWRSNVPRCSAVMTERYWILERFPAWFFNLVPAEPHRAPRPTERPPHVTLSFTLDGYLQTDRPGVLQVLADEDVTLRLDVDDRSVSGGQLAQGTTLDAGLHRVSVHGDLVRSHWTLAPLWNGRDVWAATPATMSPPFRLDRWIRPWGRLVPPLLIAGLLAIGAVAIAGRVRSAVVLGYAAIATLAMALIPLLGRESLIRVAPVMLLGGLALPLNRRLRNTFGYSLLIALPMLAMIGVFGYPSVGIFTWYSGGDDWWMFQRYAYRIFMQRYWLEGGQPTFWFQPLYRWIAGSLHMIFGDSSVGELFWDAGATVICALYAFHVTKVSENFRWGVVAAVVTVSLFTLGPPWYILGRGLSEFSSAAMLCGAALLALRGRNGYWPAAIGAGVLATLGFYTRLNNLPMAIAVVVFALPVKVPVSELLHPARLWRQASREVVVGVLGMLALGLWLFTARTWYYTGVPSMFWGTQADLTSIWRSSRDVLDASQKIVSSVMMLLTVNDPPRLDIRALPVIAGFLFALLGAAQVPWFARLPLNAIVFCLSSITGALVARGSAYPGRFSIHLIPVATAVAVCAASQGMKALGRHRASARSMPVGEAHGQGSR
jgi:hypothetical protein